jgi:tetratricopeptide (TPR) repeat protein
MFNSVAYELTEADQHLPLALEYAKRAVTEEGAASRKADLSQLKMQDLLSANSLAADWDTLGWVYFKMGNLDQAEKYLNAAWMLGQDADEADHLGKLYERENKKQAAIQMYRFALAQAKEKRSSGIDTAKTSARLEFLSPGASNPGLRSANEIDGELSQMRTTKLSMQAKTEESAEFFLLLARNKVEAVKFISGSEALKSAEAALKSASYKVEIPEDGDPRILRRGILFCSEISGCAFTMLNPSEVRSVN